jgi:adenine-specific DNA-methyltransferase
MASRRLKLNTSDAVKRKPAKGFGTAQKSGSRTTVLRRSGLAAKPNVGAMTKTRTVKQYEHSTKQRLNNPPVGLVTPDTDPDQPPTRYAFDPHLDPQLAWAGKEEKTALKVDTVSLHVHERVDPYAIIEAVRNKKSFVEQPSLFAKLTENPPLREAIDFYKHPHDWSNRLIAGDSLLVMNSLLEREGMAGLVQAIYIDPPYGVSYRSNFQPFVNRRDVKDGKDEDLTQEPEMVKAFRDTWELGLHSYLTYLRDRLVLCAQLLSDEGSVFVQISDDNLDLVKAICGEVLGRDNFVSIITFSKAGGGLESTTRLSSRTDFIVWFAKNKEKLKYRQLYEDIDDPLTYGFSMVREGPVSVPRPLTSEEKKNPLVITPTGAQLCMSVLLTKPGPGAKYEIKVGDKTYTSGSRWWGMPKESLEKLIAKGRAIETATTLRYLRYLSDFPVRGISNMWTGFGGAADQIYVVQTNPEVIQRCLLMTTDPGDLVFDPTCGSGTTAVVAEKWGRRWITCDTSRVAVSLARQRLMTSTFDYYDLQYPERGVQDGFVYRTLQRTTASSIANDEPPAKVSMLDQPRVDTSKVRVTGPFTVEAVPSPMVIQMVDANEHQQPADASVGRSGSTRRESDWRDELLKTGVRALNGNVIKFSRVEPLVGTKFLHAEATTVEERSRRVAVSFGPDYAPLEQRQVEAAWEEARKLDPRPDIILFAAFQFDPEAAKDIDEMPEAVTKKTTFLKAQMNTDLLTGDLKKKRANNQSFWLVGRPDVEVRRLADPGRNEFQVEIHGFDYYDVKTGSIDSGDATRIAMWMLDPNYDGRSLFPRQVFFPLAGEKDGWSKLARALAAELDPDRIEAYRGTVSLPFPAGSHKRAAVKIVDDRGIESLRVIDLP